MVKVKFVACLIVTFSAVILGLGFAQAEKRGSKTDALTVGRMELIIITEEPISEIVILAHGGRSNVKEYGIAVKEFKEAVILHAFERWHREDGGFDRKVVLSKEEYTELKQRYPFQKCGV